MLRTSLRSNELFTPNADVDTSTSPQISPLGSVCELIFTLVAQVVRSWMKRLGVHHQHRGRCTTKGTPVPRRSYCLNTAELEVWAVTTFASLTRRQHNTGRRAKIRRAVVIGNPERARPGGARRQHTHDTYQCRAYMPNCIRE